MNDEYDPCNECSGFGEIDCFHCRANGYVEDNEGVESECGECNGVGTLECEHCNGTGQYGD